MTNQIEKKMNAAWQSFEKSGSINAFLMYHQAKPVKPENGQKAAAQGKKMEKKK
jgi:hypothetical protein